MQTRLAHSFREVVYCCWILKFSISAMPMTMKRIPTDFENVNVSLKMSAEDMLVIIMVRLISIG